MIGMKQDLAISLLLHVSVLAVIIIFSAKTGKASRPDLNLGQTVKVSMIQEVPKGKPDMPVLNVPSMASADNSFVPEPVKLKSITKKEEIKIKEPPPQKKTDAKPKEKPEKSKAVTNQKQTDQLADTDNKNRPSGSSMEMSVGGDETGTEGIANGPLGEYYLAYNFGIVRSRIRQNWSNPVKSNSEISCKVYFQVTKNGTIRGVIVSESSGHALFDKYAEMAVKATKKLPSLPQSFPDNEVLEVNMRFVHRP